MVTSIDEFVEIDKRIDAAEDQGFREALRERWEFGKRMLDERVSRSGKGTKSGVPAEKMAELVAAIGKGQRELGYRMQFAEQYPTEANFCTAVQKFTSWTQVKKALAKPKPDKPPKPRTSKANDQRLMDIVRDNPGITSKQAADLFKAVAGETISVDIVDRCRALVEVVDAQEAVVVNWDSLPGTAAQKAETMRRQIRRELEAEFEPRVWARVAIEVGEVSKRARKMHDDAQRVLRARKGVFKKDEFDLIRSCLHPDSRASVSDRKLAEAFRVFNEADLILLDEANRPTTLPKSSTDLRRKTRS